MSSLGELREQLDQVDGLINKVGWDKANPLLKSFRHWIIEAMAYIQVKHWKNQ